MRPPSNTLALSKPKAFNIHQILVAHCGEVVLYKITVLVSPKPFLLTALEKSSPLGKVKRNSLFLSDSSSCKSKKSAPGMCALL